MQSYRKSEAFTGSLLVPPTCAQSVARPEKRILNLLALGIIP